MASVNTYELLDFGNGLRLEQWGPCRLIRPDPTTIGAAPSHPDLWATADAVYEGEKGKGEWIQKSPLPAQWQMDFDDLAMITRLSAYKHTGVFPEQQENWRWIRANAKKAERPLAILNLFAYTGGATMALAKDGHFVTHVDAAKPTIGWAKENAVLNAIPGDRIRWMLEDAALFTARERKRGKKYDAIILDPPAFGHSPLGKTWRVERDLAPLLEDCCAILSGHPAFILMNGYAHGDTPESFRRLLSGVIWAQDSKKKFAIETKELMLAATDGRTLSTGIVARCAFEK